MLRFVLFAVLVFVTEGRLSRLNAHEIAAVIREASVKAVKTLENIPKLEKKVEDTWNAIDKVNNTITMHVLESIGMVTSVEIRH